jgi:cyclic pyranopterin phosphate synthase
MSHFDEKGKIHMVDVTKKADTERFAWAQGVVCLNKETFLKVKKGEIKKGEVFATAKVSGIIAAKKTWELIPLCHPLNITFIDILFIFDEEKSSIIVKSFVKLTGRTGAEMEALTAVTVACLTIYDMCKSYDKGIQINSIHLLEKSGGKSGHYKRI